MSTRIYPDHWGFKPVLFSLGGIDIPSYTFFMILALGVGITVFYCDAKRRGTFTEEAFYILIAVLVGGSLGAKLPIWIANYKLIISRPWDLNLILSGRTIVGGLIGGTIAVVILKRILKIKLKLGNELAPALAIGIAIGRIGCFFRGCCYGISTGSTWGVNFGDGVLRQPTQLYEVGFGLGLFVYLKWLQKRVTEPGKLFFIFMNYYFGFRFLIEFLRVHEWLWLKLSGFQLVSLLVLAVLNQKVIVRKIFGGEDLGEERVLR